MSCHCCPPVTVVAPAQVVVQDIFDPQLVRVIHPINIVNRHHCVPVYEHLVSYNFTSEASKAAVCSTSPRRKKKAFVSSKASRRKRKAFVSSKAPQRKRKR